MDASMFRAWIHEAARLVAENVDHLTRLDSAVGDADHGINMRRGLQAAVAMLDETDPSTPGAVLATVGRALISKTGGASGPLYGTGFRQAAGTLGEVPDVSAAQLSPAVTAYQAVIDTGGDLTNATRAASDAAVRGLKQTAGIQARKGRASYLGARTIGHEDPGAASTVLILSALATVSSAGERRSEWPSAGAAT
jgi:dihydroxyacetone kinase-like protein